MKKLTYLKTFEAYNKDEYKVGDRVKITSDNDAYDKFKDKVLIVTDVYHNEDENPLYDMGVYPQLLMDFVTEDNNDVPYSLYEWEIEHI